MGENLEKKNTVSAKAQVSFQVSFEGKEGGSPRIMFVGNSITRHAPAPHIGWHNDHGMAASSKERDYVHTVIKEVTKRHPDASFCIVQASLWEMHYRDNSYYKNFSLATDFNPDAVLTVLSANIPAADFEHDAFITEMGKFHNYLTGGNGAKLIQSSSFFNNEEKNVAIRDYLDEVGGDFVYISDLPEDKSNLAIGEYEHEGVALHPGDKGMRAIADRLLEKLFNYI